MPSCDPCRASRAPTLLAHHLYIESPTRWHPAHLPRTLDGVQENTEPARGLPASERVTSSSPFPALLRCLIIFHPCPPAYSSSPTLMQLALRPLFLFLLPPSARRFEYIQPLVLLSLLLPAMTCDLVDPSWSFIVIFFRPSTSASDPGANTRLLYYDCLSSIVCDAPCCMCSRPERACQLLPHWDGCWAPRHCKILATQRALLLTLI